MTVSELIAELSKIEDQEAQVIISVHDHYSSYGHDAEINIEASGVIWRGITTNRDSRITRLDVHLIDRFDDTVKHPKVTFRS